MLRSSFVTGLAVAALLSLTGCGHSAAPATSTPTATSGHTHDGWWCAEHGVPEEECALCNAKVSEDLKKAGDWCEKHNRPDSQCFVCHPENEAKFAAKYEAKYGTKPPKHETATP